MFMDIYGNFTQSVSDTKNEDPLPHPPPTHSPLLFSCGRSYWAIGKRENQPYGKEIFRAGIIS